MVASDIRCADYSLCLPDGRTLAVMEVGPGDGKPVIHCHGHASSRVELHIYEQAAARQGVRLLCFDRPGIGRSSPRDSFHILDWPLDVAAAADVLGLERFAVTGMSGGGIYALACAYRIPQRLTACGLISTMATADMIKSAGPAWMKRLWRFGERVPWVFWRQIHFKSWLRGTRVSGFEAQVNDYARRLGEFDRATFRDTAFRNQLAQALFESCRQGRQANLMEAHDDFGFWGFRPQDVRCRNVIVWHGEDDQLMPPETVRLLAQAIPGARPIFLPREGHFSLPVGHMDEILATLRDAA
ncbi:MAG: alpha/beta hydrolase [Alphaproteobacteria bacterium]|nr:alpha/beta hydrolase [Alphaproteobacteria bacterium]MBL6940341.1 alpha/beta hydrolase [Alphaproteobacteria bacterium]MBL7098201.1 alpha/beta hydrolase [Alphaproteobacteria bacterium]